MTCSKIAFAFVSVFSLATAACGDDGDMTTTVALTTTTNTTPATPATATEDSPTSSPTTTDGETTAPGTDTGETTDPGTDTGSTTVEATTATGGLSFAADVHAPIIANKCGCHVPGSGGLIMGGSADTAYAAMVNVASSTGVNYVTPGDPDNSYMYHKITGTQSAGSKMPLGDTLTDDQIATIETWIVDGALP